MTTQKDRIEAAIRHIQTSVDIDPWAMELAVDALKAQGTCEDAVSRQTLQKELALYPIDDVTSEDEAGYNRAINDVQKMVLHLPSAQPQSTMGQVNDTAQSTNDCISRQAAIELIERMKPYHQEADDIAEMIANMPSAQPVLDRTKISDLLEKIYSIQSVHLSVEGVLARKYYCKQLWMELFGSEDMPAWID